MSRKLVHTYTSKFLNYKNDFFVTIFYIKRQYRIKNVEDISKDEMNITYTSKQIYKFDRKLSYPLKENDKIVVLNVAMNVSLIFIFMAVYLKENL